MAHEANERADSATDPMTSERWQYIEELLNQALDVETTQRLVWLYAACRDDEDLFQEVASLVASHADMGEFLEKPAVPPSPLAENRPGLVKPEDLVPELASGARVDDWQILRELGQGGMGTVYLAEKEQDGFTQKGALKLLHGASAQQTIRRFQQERRILAQLDHPNIARFLDGGSTSEGRPYLVMEYVQGQPIDTYCDQQRLGIVQRLDLFRRVCSAVHFFHQSLVLHRDLKPSNILVTADGEPKLLDFGVAKLLAGDTPAHTLAPTALHTEGPAPLTLDYASPEQLRGEAVTTASDVYALGVLLYELLSGHRPHLGTTSLPAKLDRLCNAEPEPPSQAVRRQETRERADGSILRLDADQVSWNRAVDATSLQRRLSGDLDSIVLKALEKRPARRYASVEQLNEDIANYLEGLPVRAHHSTPAYRSWKFVRRNAWAVAATVAFVLLLSGFTIYAEILRQRANEAARQALIEQRAAEGVAEAFTKLLEGSSPVTGDPDLTVGQLIEQVLDQLPDMLGDEPRSRARMLNEVARVFKDYGLGATEVLPLYEEAVDLQRRSGDVEELADALLNLGNNQRQFGLLAQAEISVLEGVQLYEQQGTPEQLATAYNQLAGVQRHLGEMAQAETHLRAALRLRRQELGTTSTAAATSEHNLSSLLAEVGKLEEAETLARHSLQIRRELLGQGSEVTKITLASSLGNLGRVLQDQGRLDEAIEHHRASLELRQEVHKDNPDHGSLAPAYNNLAYVQALRGDLPAAAANFEQAIRIAELPTVMNKPHLALFLRNYADLLLLQGDATRAEQLARRAQQLLKEAYPDHNPWFVAHIDSTLGASLLAQGERDEAEPLLRQGHQVLSKALGPDAAKTRAAWRRLQDLETGAQDSESGG